MECNVRKLTSSKIRRDGQQRISLLIPAIPPFLLSCLLPPFLERKRSQNFQKGKCFMVPAKHCATKDFTLSLVFSLSVSRALFSLYHKHVLIFSRKRQFHWKFKCSIKRSVLSIALYNPPIFYTIGLAVSLSWLITQRLRRRGHPLPTIKSGAEMGGTNAPHTFGQNNCSTCNFTIC